MDRALGGVAVVLALLALVMSYLGRAVLRPEAFADRAVATLHDQAVQDDVADHLTDAFVSGGGGDLVAVRPAIRALTGSIIGNILRQIDRNELGLPLENLADRVVGY